MEIVLYILIGLFIGFAAGFITAVLCQIIADVESAKAGYIKLCNEYYALTKISAAGRDAEE